MWTKNYFWLILGTLMGTLAGYIYWNQIGCTSGTCMITSKPLNSSIYGAFMGYLLASSALDFFKTKN